MLAASEGAATDSGSRTGTRKASKVSTLMSSGDELFGFFFQQNKKKAKSEGKNCHVATMWSQEKPIYLI
jgi:hypothetical protein